MICEVNYFMKCFVYVMLVLFVMVNTVALAGSIDLEKVDKVEIKYVLDDGTVDYDVIPNKQDGSIAEVTEIFLKIDWNAYNVKEIISINNIPLRDTQFSKYAGVIDKNLKNHEAKEIDRERIEENEDKSLKDILAPSDDIKIKVNGISVKFDVAPYIKDGRTMVPFRAIFEAIGANVDYDFSNPYTKLVWGIRRVDGKETRVDMKIGSKWAVKTGTGGIEMDVAPEIKEGRTFIPARYASEFLGGTVEWKANTREVIITMPQ